MKTVTNWVKGLAFDGHSDHHVVKIDSAANGEEAQGMNPKRLLLSSLSACSGMDVVGILEKMKVQFSKLEIVAEGTQTTEDPKVFTVINLTYITDASTEDEAKVKRAVELSQEKYCGISLMLKKHCPVNFTIQHVAK